jgi:hypothetical protein
VLGSTDAYILFVYIYTFTYIYIYILIYIYTHLIHIYIYTVYTLYIWLAKSAFSKLMSRHFLIRFQGQRMSVEQPVVVFPRDAIKLWYQDPVVLEHEEGHKSDPKRFHWTSRSIKKLLNSWKILRKNRDDDEKLQNFGLPWGTRS